MGFLTSAMTEFYFWFCSEGLLLEFQFLGFQKSFDFLINHESIPSHQNPLCVGSLSNFSTFALKVHFRSASWTACQSTTMNHAVYNWQHMVTYVNCLNVWNLQAEMLRNVLSGMTLPVTSEMICSTQSPIIPEWKIKPHRLGNVCVRYASIKGPRVAPIFIPNTHSF